VGKKNNSTERVNRGRRGGRRKRNGDLVDVYRVDEDKGLERFFHVDPKDFSGSEKRIIAARI
jgi:hypothetical protein